MADIYLSLRENLLATDPGEVGIEPTPTLPQVWGLVMDTGHGFGTSTLIALADGTTSLYLSSGGGIIGGGMHPQVVAASLALLDLVERDLAGFQPSTSDDLPVEGRVVLRALTFDGPRSVEADQDDLATGRHPQGGLFRAAHGVISELRQIEEQAEH